MSHQLDSTVLVRSDNCVNWSGVRPRLTWDGVALRASATRLSHQPRLLTAAADRALAASRRNIVSANTASVCEKMRGRLNNRGAPAVVDHAWILHHLAAALAAGDERWWWLAVLVCGQCGTRNNCQLAHSCCRFSTQEQTAMKDSDSFTNIPAHCDDGVCYCN